MMARDEIESPTQRAFSVPRAIPLSFARETGARHDEPLKFGGFGWWWPETGLNRRRRPFQGRALPLSYLANQSDWSCPPRRTWEFRTGPDKAGVSTNCTLDNLTIIPRAVVWGQTAWRSCRSEFPRRSGCPCTSDAGRLHYTDWQSCSVRQLHF